MANLVSLILGLAIALAGFLIQPVQAGLGTPIAVCAGQDCTITFEYSGAPYYWEPPLRVQPTYGSISMGLKAARAR
jgi:hypothetical protein